MSGLLDKLAARFRAWRNPGAGVVRARSVGYQAVKLNRLTERLLSQSRARFAEQIGNVDAARLRDVARHLVRNVDAASNAVEYIVAGVVGPGLYPQFNTGSRDADRKLELWFARLAEGIEYRDGRSWREVQEQTVREMLVTGEGLSVASRVGAVYAIEMVESEQLDGSVAGGGLLKPGERDVRGVVYDRDGRRTAYLVQRLDADAVASGLASRVDRVPASRVTHVFGAMRPSQFRGVSAFGPVAMALSDLKELDWAWLTTLRTHAGVSLYLKTPSDVTGAEALAGQGAAERDEVGEGEVRDELTWEPGTVMSGPDEPMVLQSNVPSGEAQSFRVALLQGIAGCLGVPYSALGDASRANYSSERAAEMHCRPRMSRRQDLLVERFCVPHLRGALRMALAMGDVSIPSGAEIEDVVRGATWPLPGREWVDPRAESVAMESRLKVGVWTFSDACAAHGKDATEQVERLKKEKEEFAAAGLVHPQEVLNGKGAGADVDEDVDVDVAGKGGAEKVTA